MNFNHQSYNLSQDQFDPYNLDTDDMARKRWKTKRGKVVGISNNQLPEFQKNFIDPKQTLNLQKQDKIDKFLEENEIAIGSLDGQPIPAPFLTWESTQFEQQIMNVIKKLKFSTPTPIQSVVFPLILSGYDVIGVAETGSGKTFGYLLPGLIQISCQKYSQNLRHQINGPEMLILAPTRELVMQIAEQVQQFMPEYNYQVASAFGGQNRDSQARQIKQNPQILVACPGRLKDFLQEGILSLQKVTYLVIDEADRLLDMGFEEEVRFIVEKTRIDRQTVFFSATWPKAVRNLSFDFCSQSPIYVQIGRSNLTVNKNIEQEIIFLYKNQKLQTLLDILDQLKITDKVLIFAETRVSCEHLSVSMTNEGYYAVALHGDKSQIQRDEIMKYYKQGETKLLCATDLASRGLDVSDITVVVNYDFPKYFDDYIHRIGRTGRAGRKGRAISFFSFEKDTQQMAKELLKFNSIHQMKCDLPTLKDLANGIQMQRPFNTLQNNLKYDGQIMKNSNKQNSQFRVPILSQEEKAKLYLQPHQYEIIQSRNRKNTYGRQDFGRINYGFNNNRYNERGEEQFYQDKFRNGGYNQQRRQQEQNWKSNQFDQYSQFQGQRREDYLDCNQGYNDSRRNHQSRYGNQNSDFQRYESNNQFSNRNFYKNGRTQFDNERFDRFDDQYQEQNKFNKPRFFNQERDQPYQRENQNYPRNQQYDQQRDNENYQQFSRFQQSNQREQQFQDQGSAFNYRQQYSYDRDFQNNQYKTSFNNYQGEDQWQRNSRQQNENDMNYPQKSNQRNDFNNFRNEDTNYNSRVQNQQYRQQQQYNMDNNRQGFQPRQFEQQNFNQSTPEQYRNRNFDQNLTYGTNQRNYNNYEESHNQRFNYQSNDNSRPNNTRNLVDFKKPQEEQQQIMKDSFQYQENMIQVNFNNFKPELEQQVQVLENNDDNQQNIQKDSNNQQNQDYEGRVQNQRNFEVKQNENISQNQVLNLDVRQFAFQGNAQVNQQSRNRLDDKYQQNTNNYVPQIRQEQQQISQQFDQKQVENNFINERFQNLNEGIDRQHNYNQRSTQDQQNKQTSQYLDRRQNNEEFYFKQLQPQDNLSQQKNNHQIVDRNERIQDEQDDDQDGIDFQRYSRQLGGKQNKLEIEQDFQQNQSSQNNNRQNSNSQQIENLEKDQADQNITY